MGIISCNILADSAVPWENGMHEKTSVSTISSYNLQAGRTKRVDKRFGRIKLVQTSFSCSINSDL
jgi:hypothetical protein